MHFLHIVNCEHEWIDNSYVRNNDKTAGPIQRGNHGSVGRDEPIKNAFCSLCGAWRGAFGLEPTIELYVQHTVEILREVRRVLRNDGVVFWNIGDSYFGNGTKQTGCNDEDTSSDTLKPKDLCLIPFRVALAAQSDGWWVRSVIIWNKPNPMPESVKDRPTESHEYILMLTKSERYYYDQEAVRENPEHYGIRKGTAKPLGGVVGEGRNDRETFMQDKEYFGRNLRSVWTFPTQPYKGAHFAVYPEELPERCIKAATPEVGCCAKCGAPWERIVEHKNMVIDRSSRDNGTRIATSGTMVEAAETKTLGWRPTCKCEAEKVPSLVLDPFMGSGTTLWVAKKLGRCGVGYEISKEYCELAVERNRQMNLV